MGKPGLWSILIPVLMRVSPFFLLLSSCSTPVNPALLPIEALLAEALRDWRPLKLRLRSDLYGSSVRNTQTDTSARERRQALARAESQLEHLNPTTPRLIQAQVLIDLIWGRTQTAITRVEQALKLSPGNADLLNALAVSYMQHARASNADELLVQALETIAQVVKDSPTPENRFNFALILQDLSLSHEAKKAWQAYLTEEQDTAWQARAREHLERLESPTKEPENDIKTAFTKGAKAVAASLAADPKTARDFAEQQLLQNWARAANSQAAKHSLDKLALLAKMIFEHHGDRALLDEAELLAQTRFARDGPLALGHRLLGEALQAYQALQIEESQSLLDRASAMLQKGDSSYQHKIAYYKAVNHFRSSQYSEAMDILSNLELQLPIDHLESRACTYWMIGLIHMSQERPLRACRVYEQSLDLFQQLGEKVRLKGIRNRLVEVYFFLGEPSQAWAHNQAVRRLSTGTSPHTDDYFVNSSAAEMARNTQLPLAALVFQNEAVARSRLLNKPRITSLALLARARIRHRLGYDQEAKLDLEAAQTHVPLMPGVTWHQPLGQLNLCKALMSYPTIALPLLNKALEHARAGRFAYLTAQIYLARANVNRSLGHHSEAEADLLRGIESCELAASHLPTGMTQIQFFEVRRNLFDAMIHFQAIEQNQTLLALSYAERMRARSLKQQVLTHSPEARVTRDIDDLPPRVVLLYYVVYHERLLAWCVRNGEIRFVPISVSEAELAKNIQSLADAMQQRQPIQEASAQLYEILLQPISAYLRADDSLIILPDKQLYQVPFAALFDPDQNRYLVQTYPVGSAPSIGFYQMAAARDAARVAAQEKVLLVGDPAFDPQRYAGLRPLPYAAQEAKEIAAFYPGHHQLLVGARATREAVIQAAPQHTVFHFGGHALVNHRFPESSRLILADRPGYLDDSVLQAKELASIPFKQTRLAVLAACGSAAGALSTNEGPLSLARAFLAGGVSAVLASPEDVEDRFSAAFFKRFYSFLSSGKDALEALQLTQIDMLRSADRHLAHPATWSKFRLIGGLHQTDNNDK